MGRGEEASWITTASQRSVAHFPNYSPVCSCLPPTALRRGSIFIFLTRNGHERPISSNAPEMGARPSCVSSVPQALRLVPGPLSSGFQSTRGSVGGNTRVVTAAPGTPASPQRGKQKEQHVSLKSQGNFSNPIQYPTQESGQASGTESLVCAKHTKGLLKTRKSSFFRSPKGSSPREPVRVCGKGSELGGRNHRSRSTPVQVSPVTSGQSLNPARPASSPERQESRTEISKLLFRF